MPLLVVTEPQPQADTHLVKELQPVVTVEPNNNPQDTEPVPLLAVTEPKRAVTEEPCKVPVTELVQLLLPLPLLVVTDANKLALVDTDNNNQAHHTEAQAVPSQAVTVELLSNKQPQAVTEELKSQVTVQELVPLQAVTEAQLAALLQAATVASNRHQVTEHQVAPQATTERTTHQSFQ